MSSKIKFYKSSTADGVNGSSVEARLLLPLKRLAFGVPFHALIDYFQMLPSHAEDCCKQFGKAIRLLYEEEFLTCPTETDLKYILKLHKHIRHVDGLLASLDCSHTFWKNCPKAWHGSYKGKERKPSIVLECVADYHLFFWHASYGYPGTMNDLIILSLSPLLDKMLDGTIHSLEEDAGAVPFDIRQETFNKVYLLVDGIYPRYSKFVKGIKEPITRDEKVFTSW